MHYQKKLSKRKLSGSREKWRPPPQYWTGPVWLSFATQKGLRRIMRCRSLFFVCVFQKKSHLPTRTFEFPFISSRVWNIALLCVVQVRIGILKFIYVNKKRVAARPSFYVTVSVDLLKPTEIKKHSTWFTRLYETTDLNHRPNLMRYQLHHTEKFKVHENKTSLKEICFH